MQNVTKEYLLELDKKRTKLEKEIQDLTDYLNGEGMPGVNGSLIDREGFPIAGVDLVAVRTARNKLISKYQLLNIVNQNDLSKLMESIEKNMQEFFSKSKAEKPTNTISQEKIEKADPILIPVHEDLKTNISKPKIPFAYIESVADSSPASESGLIAGDGIITFDNSVYYGVDSNPLRRIAEIVNKKLNEPIQVEISRKTNNDTEFLNIQLVPHTWSGNGVLG